MAKNTYKPTNEQLRAYLTDRHIVVEANAGSGKTAVLTDRFVEILLKHSGDKSFSLNNIVAITFTKKAAGEMKERVAQKLDEILADESYSRHWESLKMKRERFSNARITTIDSFCGQILRRYPIEADINPAFTMMDGYQKLLLHNKHISRSLEDILTGDDEDKKTELRSLIFRYGKSKVIAYIKFFINKPMSFAKYSSLYEGDDAAYRAKRSALVRKMVIEHLQRMLPEMRKLVEFYGKATKLTDRQEADKNLSISALQYLENLAIPSTTRETTALIEEINQAMEKFQDGICVTTSGTITSAIAKKVNPDELVEISPIANRYWELYAEVFHKGNAFPPEAFDADGQLFADGQLLFHIARTAYEAIEEEKYEKAIYEFEDILLTTRKLLESNASVRREIRREIRYLMIDEFQDTNSVQLDIAKRLIADLDEDDVSPTSGNLFIVGDPKQSIYRFRGADVRVFEEARKLIKDANDKRKAKGLLPTEGIVIKDMPVMFDKGTEQELGDLRLSASFRMNADTAGFVNAVCEPLMKKEFSAFDVYYSSIVCGKGDAFDHSTPVEVWISKQEDPKNKDTTANVDEAEITARLVAQAITNYDEQKGDGKYSNIAVLARSHNVLSTLAARLRAMGVPYEQHGGGKFYNAEEVQDILHILRFVHNRADDFALAATLRSPFCYVPDEQLYMLMAATKESFNISLWDRLEILCKKSEMTAQAPELQRARNVLARLFDLAPRLDTPTLIRAIVAETNWRAAIVSSVRSNQQEANIEKFIAFARDIEKSGFASITDVVEQIQELANIEEKEQEAPVITNSNAVQLMTMHASKGLEFDTIIIAGVARQGATDSQPYLDEDLGLTFDIKEFDEAKAVKDCKTAACLYSNKINKLAAAAEIKRLLYVALTRAARRLVLVGHIGKKGSRGPFLPLLEKSLEVTFPSNEEQIRESEVRRLASSLPQEQRPTDGADTIGVDVNVVIKYSDQEPQPISFERQQEEISLSKPEDHLTAEIVSAVVGEVFTPSMLLSFQKDPNTFTKRYRLGIKQEMEEEFTEAETSGSGTGDSSGGAAFGSFFHGIIENLPLWYSTEGINDEALQKIINEKVAYLPEQERNAAQAEALVQLRTLIAAPKFVAHAEHLSSGKCEKEFFVPMPPAAMQPDFLTGKIDMIFELPDGSVEIWDWKTNSAATKEERDLLEQEYAIQMKAYIYVAALMYPHRSRYTARLIFTRYAGSDDAFRDMSYQAEEIEQLQSDLIDLTRQIREWNFQMPLEQ